MKNILKVYKRSVESAFLSFFLIFSGCTLHHYSIDGESVRKLDLPKMKEKKKISISRTVIPSPKKDPDQNMVKSYNSEAIQKYLKSGCCLELAPDHPSSWNVKYTTKTEDELLYPLTVILWLFSLGIIPVFEEVNSEISFLVEDSNGRGKEYKYLVKEHAYNSWLTIPISILMIPNDSFSHSFIHMFDYPQKFIVNRFEKDLLADGMGNSFSKKSNSDSSSEKKISQTAKIAILPVKYKYAKDSSVAEAIRDKVETVLVNKKITVIERVKLDEIMKELKLSQSGLTTSDQVKVGNMLNATNLIQGEILEINRQDTSLEFSLRNIEVESGKILWKYEFLLNESDISNSLNQSMKLLDSKIQTER